ncbi:hypothetical protein T4C_10696, partial [Trichinella pseudospiralis]
LFMIALLADTGTRTEVSRHSSDPKYFLADAVVSLIFKTTLPPPFISSIHEFYYHLRDGRSWHEIIGSLTAQSCILRVCCTKEVHNHKRTCDIYLHLPYLSARDAA